MLLLAKDGYADLFCFEELIVSTTFVSTLREPGLVPNWKLGVSIGVFAVGVTAPCGPASWFLFAEMRARRDTGGSLGSLLVLMDRALPSVVDGEAAPSAEVA